MIENWIKNKRRDKGRGRWEEREKEGKVGWEREMRYNRRVRWENWGWERNMRETLDRRLRSEKLNKNRK